MPDRERRRWADTATGLGLTGQTAAAGTTVTELAASWGTGQSAVRRRRRPRWRRPGPAGSTAARPRLMGLRHRFRANRARSFSILARFSGLAADLLDPLGQLSALRATGKLGELLGQ